MSLSANAAFLNIRRVGCVFLANETADSLVLFLFYNNMFFVSILDNGRCSVGFTIRRFSLPKGYYEKSKRSSWQ